MISPGEFAAAQRETLESTILVYPTRAWYPSSLGHPCDRFLVWSFTHPEWRQPHDAILESIFREGRLHHAGETPGQGARASIYARLEEMGFDLFRDPPKPTQYRVGNAVLSGKPDGWIRGFRGERFPQLIVFEGKSLAAHSWDRLNSIDDVLSAPDHWTRGYAEQLNCYLFLENLEHGALVLKSKGTGLLKWLPTQLDYGRAECMLVRIEQLEPYVATASDPEPIAYDHGICGRCPFLGSCYPSRSLGAGATVLDAGDRAYETLLTLIAERDALAESSKEYDRLDRAVKKELREIGLTATTEEPRTILLGPWAITARAVPVRVHVVEPRVDIRYAIEAAP